MPFLKNVERKIWDVEGFAVAIKYPAGRDIRGDKEGIPTYPYDRMARNALTVAAWKEQRFVPNYVGFDVDVLDGSGYVVAGNTLLSTVRDSYVDE
jgi:hypothetical protein